MAKILYISLTGMTEPLGESQVVQYLLELAKQHTIFLLSFEKPCDKNKYQAMQDKLTAANIQWRYFEYSNQFGIVSSAWQIIRAFFLLNKWIKQENIQVIHARSLIPALIGSLLKKMRHVKLIFDIRGFAIDEKIMEGRLKENSLLSKILKNIEAKVYRQADHIVTLTHASKPIIKNHYTVNENDITVIPTCANVEIFKTISPAEKNILKKNLGFSDTDFIILRNGSINSSYDFDAEIKLFVELEKLNTNCKFLFLNKDQHAFIQTYLEKRQFPSHKYQIISANFNEMAQYLNIADFCVFFVKPAFAKQASAPTKFAELVACQLFSISNTKYGDMEFYFNSHRVGLLLDLPEVHQAPHQAAQKVMEFIPNNPRPNPADFNYLFAKHFSREVAVERYHALYINLTKEANESIATC